MRSRGQSMVELALLLPVIVLVFGITLDFSRLFHLHVGVENAAREGAAYASTNARCRAATTAGCEDPENITFRARQELGGDPELTVSVSCQPSCSLEWRGLGNRVTVQASRPFAFTMPVIGRLLGDPLVVTASATAVITR